MCLRVPDLSEAEKIDCFIRALVQDIRLQVELRGPADLHEAAMFAKRADAVITHIAGHDARKIALQKQKWEYSHQPVLMKNSGETSAQGSGGPKPMELGTASRRTLSRTEYKKLRAKKACFICQKPSHLGKTAR